MGLFFFSLHGRKNEEESIMGKKHGIDEKVVEQALSLFLRNSHWRAYYSGAPTDKCREFITFQFVDSMMAFLSVDDGKMREETRGIMLRAERELMLADWRYLLLWCGKNPRYPYILEMIRSLEGNEKPKYRRIGFELLNPYYVPYDET